MEITDYHAKYFSEELTKNCASNSLEKLVATLSDAQVDLNPHQVEAALFAFKSPLSKGAILADEVGLGKTIEAGIVISQKWAERKRKILVITPSNLRKQWNQELLEKFFIPSVILESKSFSIFVKEGLLNPFQQDDIVICSYHFARNKQDHIKQIGWDLVVIDEAHRLRNVYKPSNKIASAIKEAIKNCPIVLLTATPLQNSLMELFGLVSFIDEHTFGDKNSFRDQFARLTGSDNFDELKSRLRPMCKRTLRKQVTEYIKYTNRIPITQEFVPYEDEQVLYEMVSSYLQRENLQALPRSQRSLIILVLRKLLASSTFAIAGALHSMSIRLHEKLKDAVIVEETEEVSTDFEAYNEISDEWQDENAKIDQITLGDKIAIEKEIKELESFYELAMSITNNAKGKALLIALKEAFEKAKELGASRKAIIFTESRRTQNYLLKLLSENGYKDNIVLFNGSNTDEKSKQIYKEWYSRFKDTDKITGSKTADMRSALVDYFKNNASIMLATEAAAEGINLQFCSLVVNYDLPWNPQRIEQRIGRGHRYGQKHDVVVVNFLNKKNAADQRVYELLRDKFQLFSGVFGASDEVLGSIESGVDFEKKIVQIYQECRTTDEINNSFDELQKELEQQINENLKETRHSLLEHFDEEVTEKLKINLKESAEYLNRYENWLWLATKHFLRPYAEFGNGELSFELKTNPFNEGNIGIGLYKFGKNIDNGHIYRIGHPLAQNIINYFKQLKLNNAELIFDYTNSLKKITILEPFVGSYGFLKLVKVTIKSLEQEDFLIFTGSDRNNQLLDDDQCKRLFSLSVLTKIDCQIENVKLLDELIETRINELVDIVTSKNSRYFDEEMEKLDKWAEDLKTSIELEIKELDREIKTLKTEARKISKLDDKVKAQREIKELEKKRNLKRRNLFIAQDEIDERKANLIDEIEERLKQKVQRTELFYIKWKLV